MTRWDARFTGNVQHQISEKPSDPKPVSTLIRAISVARPWFQNSGMTA